MSDFNPFEAPTIDSRPIGNPASEITLVLTKFRQQMTALGAVWIFFGCFGMAASGTMLFAPRNMPLNQDVQLMVVMIALGILGVVWFGVGIATCLKKMWAVYVGLGISYLSLLGNLSSLNVCGLVIVILVIIQGHRVVGFSKTLLAAGVPLNSKP